MLNIKIKTHKIFRDLTLSLGVVLDGDEGENYSIFVSTGLGFGVWTSASPTHSSFEAELLHSSGSWSPFDHDPTDMTTVMSL